MILKKIFWNGCFSKKIHSWLLIFNLLKMMAGLFYECRLFKHFEYCLLKIGQTWRLWRCLAQTVLKTTLPWQHLACSFHWFPEMGWGLSKNGTGHLHPPTSRFWAWCGQSCLLWKRTGGPPQCTGSWKGTWMHQSQLALFSVVSDFCMPQPFYFCCRGQFELCWSYSPFLL